jgi:hypothetical protein
VNSRTLSVVAILAVVLVSLTSRAHSEEAAHHVLMADYMKGGLTYMVDGRAPKENEGLLLALSRARSADRSARPEIVLLVHERARLVDLSNLVGMVMKADFASYRIFVFDGHKRGMTEIRYSTPVGFAADGSTSREKK